MKTYEICLMGCDDETRFNMELTDTELELVQRICKLSEETSDYGCMPTMTCEEVSE